MRKLTITREGVPGKTVVTWEHGQQGIMTIDDGGGVRTVEVQDFSAFCYDHNIPIYDLISLRRIELRGSVLIYEEDPVRAKDIEDDFNHITKQLTSEDDE